MFITVNGINDSRSATTGALVASLPRGTFREFEYKPVNVFTARWRQRTNSGDLAALVREVSGPGWEKPVDLIGHSHGCNLIHKALALHGVRVRHVFMVSPALNARTDWTPLHPQFRSLYCFHNPYDLATLTSGLLLFHPFGWAGNIGFMSNGKVRNEPLPSRVGLWNHTENWFTGTGLSFLSSRIMEIVQMAGDPPEGSA